MHPYNWDYFRNLFIHFIVIIKLCGININIYFCAKVLIPSLVFKFLVGSVEQRRKHRQALQPDKCGFKFQFDCLLAA